jgi:acyl-coenzyme A synthetase/AMP-(fatty) acid ligase
LAKIISAPKYSQEEITRELREEIGKILTEDEFKFEFEFVDQMPLTHRGKLNFLDQRIPLNFEDIADAGY